MTLKEGRCPNCGSILHLDAKAEKGHCLFCDAVFQYSEAFSKAENPDGHTFPNEPQPKYEGPSLQPGYSGSQKADPARARKQQPQPSKPKPPPPPVYEMKEPQQMPDIRIPGKTKIKMLIGFLVVVLLAVGITVPILMNRDSVRAELTTAIPGIAEFPLTPDRDISIWHVKNDYIMIATEETLTEEEVIDFFKRLCEKRASILSMDTDDFQTVYGSVKLKLVTPDGGFLINQPKSETDLAVGKAITLLP